MRILWTREMIFVHADTFFGFSCLSSENYFPLWSWKRACIVEVLGLRRYQLNIRKDVCIAINKKLPKQHQRENIISYIIITYLPNWRSWFPNSTIVLYDIEI